MNEQIYFDSDTEDNKRWVWWLYLLHGVSMAFSLGALSFVPLILNYLKRGDTTGSFLHAHHCWQIRSFWWYIVWMIVGGILFVTVIGIPVAVIVWLAAWV